MYEFLVNSESLENGITTETLAEVKIFIDSELLHLKDYMRIRTKESHYDINHNKYAVLVKQKATVNCKS